MASKSNKNCSQMDLFDRKRESIAPLPEPPIEEKTQTEKTRKSGKPITELPEDDDIPFKPGTIFKLIGVVDGCFQFWYD